MSRKLAHAVLAAALAVLPAGCTAYKNKFESSTYDYGSRKAGDPKMSGERLYGSTTGDPHQHDNRWVEYSSMLSNEVSRINGVAGAIVMLTDRNAYVGILLDWTGVGTVKDGGDRRTDQDMGGSGAGVYNNNTGSPYWDGRETATPYNSYFTVNDIGNLSEELKQTIASRVRALAPTVEEVHISANREFVNELTEYAREAWGGRPLSPWIEAFNTLVKHQFAGGDTLPTPLAQLKARSGK